MATSFLAVLSVLITILYLIDGSYLLNDVGSCGFGELPCDNGQCIPRDGWCNGRPECHDGSDENYCRMSDPSEPKGLPNINNCIKSRHFKCDSAICIPKAGRCDDMPDCENGEDEENCDYLYDSSDDESSSTPPTTSSTTIASTTAGPKPSRTTRISVSGIPARADVLRKSVTHVLEERDVSWGWGKSTPRMVTALYLANGSYFDVDNFDGLMTKKQLEVQLALDLMRNSDRPLRMHELSHYVHALLATCRNPKNFHGVNVMRLLKKLMNKRHSRGLLVSPLAYLALCNAGDFSDSFIRRLKNMAYRRSEEQRWLDVQAYALLAISCRARDNASSKEWRLLKKDVAKNITDWQQSDGSFGSIYSTGLALQALLSAEEPGTESNKGRAMTYLQMQQDWQGSFGSELNNYYVLPALNMNSLASVGGRKCKPLPYDTQSTEAAKKKKKRDIYMHYSLWLGGDKNEIHTITLGLPRHSNFLEVMDAAEKINPRYKHEVWTTAKGTAVSSIAGKSSDAEHSTYWTLYRKVPLPFRPQLSNTTSTVARLKLLGAKRWIRDLRKLHPRDGEHLAFWYKPYI